MNTNRSIAEARAQGFADGLAANPIEEGLAGRNLCHWYVEAYTEGYEAGWRAAEAANARAERNAGCGG